MMAPCRCRSWRTRLLVSRSSSRSERAPTVEVMAGRVAVVTRAISTFLAPVCVPQAAGRVQESGTVNLVAVEVAIDSPASSCCGPPFAATPNSAFSAASISTRRSSCDVLPHEFLKTRHCHAHHSAVLSSLAQIDPASVAAHIERSLGELNPSDVVTHVRPNLVRSLSTIAFNSSTFSIGARLLLRVATAEERAASSMTHPLRGAFIAGPTGAARAFQSLFRTPVRRRRSAPH